MAAAIQLAARVGRRSDVEVTLVNAHEKFTERLRLPMTATGQQLAELSIPELLAGTGARFVRGWVTALDVRAKTVRIDDDRVLPYDTLVYGLGSVADTAAVPGVDDYAYTLNSAQDAEVLGGRLNQVGHGTVVVVGSGLTGVESAAVRQAAHRAREHVQAPRPRVHRATVAAARGCREVLQCRDRWCRQRPDGVAGPGRDAVDGRRRQGPPGPASDRGCDHGRVLVRRHRHRDVPRCGARRHEGGTRRDQRWAGHAAARADRVIATVTFDFDADGRITAIHNVADPDKVRAVADGSAHDLGTR